LGRFSQPDSIIPSAGFSIAWDRYAGLLNNPIRYSDPSGHRPDDGCLTEGCSLQEGEEYRDYIYNIVYGPVDREKNTANAKELLEGTIETAAGILWEPLDWFIALKDGFQWEDTLGLLPFVSASVGSRAAKLGSKIISKLPTTTRITLRKQAVIIFRRAYPDLASASLQIHHRIPLEWAHLFPEANPNRLANLIGLDPEVHKQVNKIWGNFRNYYSQEGIEPTAHDVLLQALKIDEIYSNIYNKAAP
jgi:hypothetical protein